MAQIKQYRVVIFGNGQEYDTDYVGQPKFQQTFKKLNILSPKPLMNVLPSRMLCLGLIKSGNWYDQSWSKFNWAHGPYIDVFEEIVPLPNPLITYVGGNNGAKIAFDTWQTLIHKNPIVVESLRAWRFKYWDHLQKYKYLDYRDIPYRTLKMPWCSYLANLQKTIENRKHNLSWKIDSTDSRFNENVRCYNCVSKLKQCNNCLAIQSNVNKANKKQKKQNNRNNAKKKQQK